jgi:hypothetical protein
MGVEERCPGAERRHTEVDAVARLRRQTDEDDLVLEALLQLRCGIAAIRLTGGEDQPERLHVAHAMRVKMVDSASVVDLEQSRRRQLQQARTLSIHEPTAVDVDTHVCES